MNPYTDEQNRRIEQDTRTGERDLANMLGSHELRWLQWPRPLYVPDPTLGARWSAYKRAFDAWWWS